MANFQLAALTLAGTTPAFRLAEVSLIADPPPSGGPVLRLMQVLLSGTGGAPTITAGPGAPDGPVAPGTTVSLTVVADGDWTDVAWVVQDGGLPVALAGGGLARQFVAPYDPAGGGVLLAVTAHGPGGDSDPVFFGVQVSAHPDWYLAGGVWMPTLSTDTLGD